MFLFALLLLGGAAYAAPAAYAAAGEKEFKAGQEAEARQDYDEALRQYRVCRDLLRHELGIGPLPETERPVERVRNGPAG
jgi:DNA-binding SARP family transcriptional activator